MTMSMRVPGGHPWWERAERGHARADSGWEAPCYFALRYSERLCGLTHVAPGVADGVMVFPECHSVHTFGVEFDLDVLLLDDDGRVMRSCRRVGRGRVVGAPGACIVVEREASDDAWPIEGDVVRFARAQDVGALCSRAQVQATVT